MGDLSPGQPPTMASFLRPTCSQHFCPLHKERSLSLVSEIFGSEEDAEAKVEAKERRIKRKSLERKKVYLREEESAKGDPLCFPEQVRMGLWTKQNTFIHFFCIKSFLENEILV